MTVFILGELSLYTLLLIAWTRLHVLVYASQQSIFPSLSDAREILNDKLTWGQYTLHMWSYHITSKLSRSVTLQLFCDIHLHRHDLHKQANMLYTQKQAHRRTHQRRDRKLCELIIGCKDYSLWLQQRETDRQELFGVLSHTDSGQIQMSICRFRSK